MTLLDLLTLICYTTPPGIGIVAGKEAGVVGIMIGMGVGLVAGGLANYAVRKTTYSDKLEERLKSQPQVVQQLMDSVLMAWAVFLICAAALMTFLLTRFIVQQMAG
jgi:hypothetical protein